MSVSTGQPAEEATEETRPAPGDRLPADHYNILGHQAAVTVAPEEVRRAVRCILRGFGPTERASGPDTTTYTLTPAERGGWIIDVDGTTVNGSDKLETALGFLEWRIVSDALERRKDLLHLHGGSLCVPTRRAGIVLAGNSGSGKTTLTQGLMLRGFTPFGDDVALIDPATLELQVVHRAFHVTDKTWQLLAPLAGGVIGTDEEGPEGYFSPPQWAERPVPVRWVLFPEYRPGQQPQLLRLPQAEAAAAVLAYSVSLTGNAGVMLPAAARLTEHAKCYRFLTGDLTASVEMVQQLVGV